MHDVMWHCGDYYWSLEGHNPFEEYIINLFISINYYQSAMQLMYATNIRAKNSVIFVKWSCKKTYIDWLLSTEANSLSQVNNLGQFTMLSTSAGTLACPQAGGCKLRHHTGAVIVAVHPSNTTYICIIIVCNAPLQSNHIQNLHGSEPAMERMWLNKDLASWRMNKGQRYVAV